MKRPKKINRRSWHILSQCIILFGDKEAIASSNDRSLLHQAHPPSDDNDKL